MKETKNIKNVQNMTDTIHGHINSQDGRAMAKADIKRVVKAFTEVVADTIVNGGEVYIPGIGKIIAVELSGRKFRNVRTGKMGESEPRKYLKFRASRPLVAKVRGEK